MILTSIGPVSADLARMSDPELIVAVRQGRRDALEALFQRYARLVYRVAADILKDRGEAEDSTQEILFEIFRKAHLYDPQRGTVRGWMLRYAYRRTLRRRESLTRRAAYRSEPIERVDELPQLSPRLSSDECRWVLRAGLAHLPEKQRTTLELTCFENLTLRDVAGRLGVSLGCTRHYYYRGIAGLQRWARITCPSHAPRSRSASRVDRADAVTARARLPHDAV